MVLPDFLGKSRASKEDGEETTTETYKVDLPYKHDSSESDTETTTFEKQTNANGKAKLSAKWKVPVVVVLLVLATLTVVVIAFVNRALQGAETSVGCDLYLHKYVHKGKVIHENGSLRVKIQCDEGYKLIGSPVVECLLSGHWSQTPTCVSNECKHLPVPEHADVKLKKVASSIMQELEVSCHEGYLLEGNRTVVCQSDEAWSQIPVCNPIDCGGPAGVENGKIENLNETTYSNTFQVECNEGYYLSKGNETVKCESDGKWDESPECAPVSCRVPTNPNHARISNIEGTVFKKTVVFQCIEGFLMKGDSTITCRSNGEWSPSPVCKRVDCGLPPPINNGRIKNLIDTFYNSAIYVECCNGYVLKGSGTVKCESNGKWDDMPECAPVSCGVPTNPNQARILNKEGTVFKKTVVFQCIEGFLMKGDSTITCRSNGEWSPSPVCKRVDCGLPPPINNGRIKNLIDTFYNSAINVECCNGYVLKGSGTVKCESNGKWDDMPECAPVSCGVPTNPNQARILNKEGTVFKKTVVFQCIGGFQMKGDPKTTCQSNGVWSPSPVCERVDCGYPPHIDNGNMFVLGGTTFEMSVTFKCTAGYRLKGNPRVTCQSNGKWTENPKCEYISDPCYSNPCYSGHCVATGYSYTCTSSNTKSSGFSGIFCEPISKKFSLLFVCFLVFQVFMNF